MDANMFGTCHSLGLQVEDKSNVRIFPNPSSDIFYIEGLEIGKRLEIRNELGQLVHVFESQGELNSIDVRSFTNGLYFVHFSESSQEPIKLIILH
jgi:hypothetical protein